MRAMMIQVIKVHGGGVMKIRILISARGVL